MNPTGRPRTDIKKILIIRLRRIGDVVMTTPAVALLKKHFPDSNLTYLIEEPFRRLVEGNPALDRVISVPVKQTTADFLRLIREIRRERYGALLDFHGGPRASWLTITSRAGLKIGYSIKTKSFLYDIKIPREGPDGPIHSVRNHANLVRALGAQFGDDEIPPLFLPAAKSEEIERVRQMVWGAGGDCGPRIDRNAGAGVGAAAGKGPGPGKSEGAEAGADMGVVSGASAGGAKIVVLHIGAGNRFRDWGIANISTLLRLFAQLNGIKTILIGAESDATAAQKIMSSLIGEPGSVISCVGCLNLIETRELIARAALFVGPDSGPMHIAASTATPIVAYFGPTLPAVFAPWRPDGRTPAVILEKDIDCRPCRQHECITNDYRCLLTITPDDVFSACRKFL